MFMFLCQYSFLYIYLFSYFREVTTIIKIGSLKNSNFFSPYAKNTTLTGGTRTGTTSSGVLRSKQALPVQALCQFSFNSKDLNIDRRKKRPHTQFAVRHLKKADHESHKADGQHPVKIHGVGGRGAATPLTHHSEETRNHHRNTNHRKPSKREMR